MTRETRINLIFLLVLIPLLLPGGIKLFRAKLDPEARRMFKPDFTRKDAIYINYDDHRPDIDRVVPPTTSQWVQFEASQMFHPSVRGRIRWHRGLASKAHRFEVVGVVTTPESGSTVALVTWDARITSPTFKLGQEAMSIAGQFTWALPPAIRKELQNGGFVLPPEQVTAYLLQAASATPGQVLSVHYLSADAQPVSDQVTMPSSAEAQETSQASPPPDPQSQPAPKAR